MPLSAFRLRIRIRIRFRFRLRLRFRIGIGFRIGFGFGFGLRSGLLLARAPVSFHLLSMRSTIVTAGTLVALGLGLLVGGLGVSSSQAQTRAAGSRPQCVQVSSEARFDGVGFQHWVTVNNTCTGPVDCTISTDVAPSPVSMHLAARERREISTFLSSPARAFAPTVECTEPGR